MFRSPALIPPDKLAPLDSHVNLASLADSVSQDAKVCQREHEELYQGDQFENYVHFYSQFAVNRFGIDFIADIILLNAEYAKNYMYKSYALDNEYTPKIYAIFLPLVAAHIEYCGIYVQKEDWQNQGFPER